MAQKPGKLSPNIKFKPNAIDPERDAAECNWASPLPERTVRSWTP